MQRCLMSCSAVRGKVIVTLHDVSCAVARHLVSFVHCVSDMLEYKAMGRTGWVHACAL